MIRAAHSYTSFLIHIWLATNLKLARRDMRDHQPRPGRNRLWVCAVRQQCREAWIALTHPSILCSTWQMASPEIQEAGLESQRSRKQASTAMASVCHSADHRYTLFLLRYLASCLNVHRVWWSQLFSPPSASRFSTFLSSVPFFPCSINVKS